MNNIHCELYNIKKCYNCNNYDENCSYGKRFCSLEYWKIKFDYSYYIYFMNDIINEFDWVVKYDILYIKKAVELFHPHLLNKLNTILLLRQ